MRPETFRRIQTLFHEALDLEPEARIDYVERNSDGDREVVEEVVALLEHESRGRHISTGNSLALAAEAFDAAETRALVGKTIGRFRLEAEIASGGMGRVFRAKRIDSDLEQVVAVKLIREEIFNESLLKRFSSERQILAGLNHPGIAHLIDAGTDERGTPFVAMEYVDGLPLQTYCARHAPSTRERIAIFREILAAVSYAHRNLVLHRDLKPDNILITPDGKPKLLDFGIAKSLAPTEHRTMTVDRFFTPAYAAPEFFQGRTSGVSSDVYALGAILYALLAGTAPFESSGQTPSEIERRILKVPPPSMRSAMLNLDEANASEWGLSVRHAGPNRIDHDLESIVQKALRKEPESRYAGVDQFDEDLARYLERRPVLAASAGRFYRTRKFCERNLIGVSITLLIATASAFGIAYILQQNSQIKQERDRAQIATRILKNAIGAANPSSIKGRNYSQARIILSAVSREVDTLEKSQPDVFRDLAIEFGEIQVNLGMVGEGLSLIRRANRMGAEPSPKGLLLEIFGLIKGGDLKNARKLLESKRSSLEKYADFSAREAFLLMREKRYDEAIAVGSRLLADHSAQKNSIEDWKILRDGVRLSLAESYDAIGKSQDAVKQLGVLVTERRLRFGADHPLTTSLRVMRAQMQVGMGEIAAAERDLAEMRPVIEKSQDIGSDSTLGYYSVYAQVLGNLGREEEAIQFFLKALDSSKLSYGPDSKNTASIYFNIALMMATVRDDRREAYQNFLRAIEMREKFDREDWNIGLMRLQTARFYAMDGDDLSVKRMLTPEHAPGYFEGMPEPVRKEYMQALHSRFDWKGCASGAGSKTANQDQHSSIAGILLCRYDPKAEYRGSEWPLSDE
jgi:eukaryotic-like serine/threonine-protein kinase